MAELMAALFLPCAQAVLFAVGDTIGQGSSRKAGSPWDWPRAFALPALDSCVDATLASVAPSRRWRREMVRGADTARRCRRRAGALRDLRRRHLLPAVSFQMPVRTHASFGTLINRVSSR